MPGRRWGEGVQRLAECMRLCAAPPTVSSAVHNCDPVGGCCVLAVQVGAARKMGGGYVFPCAGGFVQHFPL